MRPKAPFADKKVPNARRRGPLDDPGSLQSAMFNSVNFCCIATDGEGIIQIFSVGAERLLGHDAKDLINKLSPAHISDSQELIARAKALTSEYSISIVAGFQAFAFKASRGVEDSFEMTFVRKNGTRFPAIVSLTPLRGPQEAVIGYLLIANDNTARKQIEGEQKRLAQRLREYQFYARSLFEANLDAVITADIAGTITDANRPMELLTGRRRDELIGASFKSLFTDPDRADAGIRLVLDEKKITNYELTARARDGKETVVSYNATTLLNRDGTVAGFLAAARDSSVRRRLEDSLRMAMQKAKQANLAKSQFLANMSHEIRTPMNAVVGLTYLLERTQLNSEQSETVAKLKQASSSLLALINDVLDLSKIEAGELKFENAVFNLRNLVQELADIVVLQATAKGLTFTVDTADDIPVLLEGDAARVSQILLNLLSNAVKFTEFGGVKLRIRRLATMDRVVRIRFDVRDTGIGISTDVQGRLFAPFAQGDTSISRRFGGSGLGLSIVKRLVDLMGGEVRLESYAGVGSEFTVSVDFALAPPDRRAEHHNSPRPLGENLLLGVRVLVVDDSDINLHVANRILALEGAHVKVASSGTQAIEYLRDRPTIFDVVLMDIQMPCLNGYEATQIMRDDLKLADLPIIAVTAGAMTSERQRVMASGMNDYVSKPFEPGALIATILRSVRRSDPPHPRRVDAPEGVHLGPSIEPWPQVDGIDGRAVRELLRDDLPLFRSMLRLLLVEFTSVAITTPSAAPADLAFHTVRMHKLKSCAYHVGANEIGALAGESEAACRAGDVASATRLTGLLDSQLQKLRCDCVSVFDPANSTNDKASLSGHVPEASALLQLIKLLRQYDLLAISHFDSIAPQIKRLLGPDAYELLRVQMGDLKFLDAARTLESTQRP